MCIPEDRAPQRRSHRPCRRPRAGVAHFGGAFVGARLSHLQRGRRSSGISCNPHCLQLVVPNQFGSLCSRVSLLSSASSYTMAGGWPGPGSLSFRLSHLLGAALPGGARRAAQGDAVLGDSDGGLPAKPRKSARFPLKAALTASALATTGDTVAQLVDRYKKRKALEEQQQQQQSQGIVEGADAASALVNQVIGHLVSLLASLVPFRISRWVLTIRSH